MSSKILIRINGKRVERFIQRLYDNNIEMLNIDVKNKEEAYIRIYKDDIEKLLNLKSIYEVEIIRYYGPYEFKRLIKKNIFLLIIGILGIILLFTLSYMIFDIRIIHNDPELRELLISALEEHGIKKYTFRSSYEEITNIKTKILEIHKDKIEWLEIERHGTKYIVRAEMRIIPDLKEDKTPRSIIAKKSAIIQNIIASDGVVERIKGQYVNKGDIIINGVIKLNESEKARIKAEGRVFGEVWYTVDVEYPYIYSETRYTGNEKKIVTFNILNKHIGIFKKKYTKYKNKIIYKIGNNLLPIYFAYENQKEIEVIEYILTKEEALEYALKKAREKMEKQLKEDEYIIYEKELKVNYEEEKIRINMFYAIYEDITEYRVLSSSD